MKNNWSLVVHEVGVDYVQLAVGTLFPNERKYEGFFVEVLHGDSVVKRVMLSKNSFDRPFRGQQLRFYQTIVIAGLTPSVEYTVRFGVGEQEIYGIQCAKKILSDGSFMTLPSELVFGQKPFVVALGSCYYDEDDGKRTVSAYQALRNSVEPASKPDVKFLLGDQVYLDIGIDSLSPRPVEITSRIADDYARSWQSLREMLRNGGTWMLSDDHEFWNDYPHISIKNPYLWMLRASSKAKAAWRKAAKDGVLRVQNVTPIRTFKIGDDLSFCFADVRTYRTKHKFMPTRYFDQLIAWAKTLITPGVLIISQPLIVSPNGGEDLNLANFEKQYRALLQALASTGRDIVVLAGDVHFGRVGSVALGEKGGTLHEIISSPLSNLAGVLGVDGKLAASTAFKMHEFPAKKIGTLEPKPVIYPVNWSVESEEVGKWYKPGFTYEQTKEHMFTLAFSKLADGKIKLDVQAWRIRHRYIDNLPQREFETAIEYTLH